MLSSDIAGPTRMKYKIRGLSRYRVLCSKKKKAALTCSGSLTAEAALVLPFFLMVVTGMLLLFQIMVFQLRLQRAIDYALQRAAACCYATDLIQNSEGESDAQKLAGVEGVEEDLLTGGLTVVYVRRLTLDQMETAFLHAPWITGGKNGLTFFFDGIPDSQGVIDLLVRYEVKIPFLPGKVGRLAISQRSMRRVWTGTRRWKDKETEKKDEETTVYITEHGTVYHLSLDCSYLKLSIRTAAAGAVSELRNKNGGKYYLCEKCGKGPGGYEVYVTDSGNRYHLRLSCPSLSRNIRKTVLSEAEGLNPCSRCGTKGAP